MSEPPKTFTGRIVNKLLINFTTFRTAEYIRCFLKADAVKFKIRCFQTGFHCNRHRQSRGHRTTEHRWASCDKQDVRLEDKKNDKTYKQTKRCSGEDKKTFKNNSRVKCTARFEIASREWRSNCKINQIRLILRFNDVSAKNGLCPDTVCTANSLLDKNRRTFVVCVRFVNSTVPMKRGADGATLYVLWLGVGLEGPARAGFS